MPCIMFPPLLEGEILPRVDGNWLTSWGQLVKSSVARDDGSKDQAASPRDRQNRHFEYGDLARLAAVSELPGRGP
jgi:hypothetical protein